MMQPPNSSAPNPNEIPALPNNGFGNNGAKYGLQQKATWSAGDPAPKKTPVIDVTRADSLWLVHVEGPILFDLTWGTSGTFRLYGLSTPARFAVPGFCNIEAYPIAAGPLPVAVEGKVSLTPIHGQACCPGLRKIVGAGDLPIEAASYFALSDSVLTVAGVVGIAVPKLTRCLLSSGAVLTSGAGFAEFEP